MYTVGTAGHVDHGKSTLVKALTGIDPDRLREEKERGMTIDLGFAWLKLPSGREISIVDVPGHERFIKNMLAGVGGIDLGLLVVAADEGVMPQTEEHLAILDLLRVRRGVVALTKKDLVEEDWLELVSDDLRGHLKGTVLEDAPLIAVSAMTREGLPELLAILDRLLADMPPKTDKGRPRLPIDRVFTIAGFGTVVTGTLVDGQLQIGQEVEVLPRGLKSRIRGLQTHKHKVDAALPGSRVAVNLVGLATSDLQRGDVLTAPRWMRPTRVVDVKLAILRSAPKPLLHNATVNFFVGAAETACKVALLDKAEAGPAEECWAQLRLVDAVAVTKGDLFVIRTPNETIGGGEVVEPHPKRHRRFQAATIDTLELLRKGTPEEIVAQAIGDRVPLEQAAISRRTGLGAGVVRGAVEALARQGAAVQLGEYFISAAAWARLSEQAAGTLRAHHGQFPLRPGMPKEELKSRLGLPAKLFNEVVGRLSGEGRVVEVDSVVRLADHAVRFTADQERRIGQMMAALAANRYTPPGRAEVEQQFGVDPEVVNALLDQGKLAKLNDAIVFPAEVYQELVARVIARIEANGKITVAEVRDIFNTSRKYALALMEHLDERRVTRRVGDERMLR